MSAQPKEEHDVARPIPICCRREMREVPISIEALALFVCDQCRDRRWVLGQHVLHPELARRLLAQVAHEHRTYPS
jgi:hypothetical protein